MVEQYTSQSALQLSSQTSMLNTVFNSLSDPTRRDILLRVSSQKLSIGELAKPYNMSFAAVAKHVAVLESAKLVIKHKSGKLQLVTVSPNTLKLAQAHLSSYEKMWRSRFDALDELLKK